MTTVIIDYGSGNLRSAEKSFPRMAAHANDIVVTAEPEAVAAADRIVLPGVGAFADCHEGLLAIDGMGDALAEAALSRAVPFLGICVGMQLLATTGTEHGVQTPGLGWIDGEVKAIMPNDPDLKIPHMGWNALEFPRPHPLFDGIPAGMHAYFVHSYHVVPRDASVIMATTDHGGTVTAAIGRDNIFGTQFHPEKSQKLGLKLIENFLSWTP